MEYRSEDSAASEINSWLRGDRRVVTASERTARSLTAAYHRSRRAEGLTAWPAPQIQHWQSFVLSEWEKRESSGRIVLNSLQEPSLWGGILSIAGQSAALLTGPRYRLANLAIKAHELLCGYAPEFLKTRARAGWQRDAGEFSAWLAEYDRLCHAGDLVSAARLPLELAELLANDSAARPPILLAGFDRILPTQRRLFSAWGGEVRESPAGPIAQAADFYIASDPGAELAACALWCGQRLGANPDARLLVVTQDVAKRRGEMERTFLRYVHENQTGVEISKLIEFSLGVPLGQIALVRTALLLLRWLSSPLEEHEVDWLFSSSYAIESSDETRLLTGFMRAIRRKGWQRQRWTLADFLRQSPGAALPLAWIARLTQAQKRLLEMARRQQTPLVWAELVPQVLSIAGWPGMRPLGSAEFQVASRWQQTVENAASLGFDGCRMNWPEFRAELERAASETLFAPESQDAPILIAGPAESAGLTADGVWFLDADAESWPARGSTHPFLPLGVQRESHMPNSASQVDWDLAAAMTRRLLASAPEVHFSYARQSAGVEMRPSRIVTQILGAPQSLPEAFTSAPTPPQQAIPFADTSRIPFPPGRAAGGSDILTSQSQCAFKAFATSRLGARKWDAAEAGLTAAERGLLLHAVMHSIWSGPPDGIRSQGELAALGNLESFVERHVDRVLHAKLPTRARESMPHRYLELEGGRLTRLLAEWLRLEQTRIPFTVAETEVDASPAIAGLTLRLRLDRVDVLSDGTQLVIDYKTGDVNPKCWDPPRPDDVQLPLYALFALDPRRGPIGGLAFAKVRAGEMEFAGRFTNAKATLLGNLRGNTNLVKNPLTAEQLGIWKRQIEQLAMDFLAGRADVDPRDYPETCERCDLYALCRVEEIKNQAMASDDPDRLDACDG